MDPNENPDEGFETSSAKVVFGIRITPELKETLVEEAESAGFNTSELGEMILANRHQAKTENERLTQLVVAQQKEIEKMKAQVAETSAKQSEVAQAENEALRKKVEGLNNQLAIYSDKRLLYLLEHLKGKTDTVDNAYGDNFPITYQSAREVLIAIIYNTKLNQ